MGFLTGGGNPEGWKLFLFLFSSVFLSPNSPAPLFFPFFILFVVFVWVGLGFNLEELRKKKKKKKEGHYFSIEYHS